MSLGPRPITRRAALLGAATSVVGLGGLGLACSTSATAGRIIGPSRDTHWTTALFGRPAGARLVKRASGYVPPNQLVPFFRDWQTGQTGAPWPSVTAGAGETEIYADLSGDKLAIFRGMPAGTGGPNARVWRERGRTGAGVSTFHASPFDYYRLFILPDGTWISGYGLHLSQRLSSRFATDASAFPTSPTKPGALFVQEVAETHLEHVNPLPSNAILGSDRILGSTVATYPAADGADVPTDFELHFPSSDLAGAAAADLARTIGASRAEMIRSDQAFRYFLARATITSEGERLVMRGPVRYQELVRWTAP